MRGKISGQCITWNAGESAAGRLQSSTVVLIVQNRSTKGLDLKKVEQSSRAGASTD